MIGTAISHYRILEKLGAGGMAGLFSIFDCRLWIHSAVRGPL